MEFYAQALITEVIEHKAEEDKIIISWVISTPRVDRHDDIVELSALERSFGEYMNNPVVLLQHNHDKVIWRTLSLSVDYDKQQASFTAEINNDINWVFKNIKTWSMRGLSIGFILKSWEWIQNYSWDTTTDIRKITWLELIEISVVSIPANPDALFTLSKSIKKMFSQITTKWADAPTEPTTDSETPIVDHSEEEEWKSPENDNEWNAQEEWESLPVEEPIQDKLSERIDKLEELVHSLSLSFQESKSSISALDVKSELDELKKKLAKTEIVTSKKITPRYIDARTGNIIL